MRNWSNVVLMTLDQRLETLADIKPTFGECAVLAGKVPTVNMLWVNCFQTPMVTQPFVSQHKAHIRELVNYFLIDVVQIYRVYIWFVNLLLMRRCAWNTFSIIILADNCGCGVICYCGMSRGHCCILGTPLSSVFWQLTIPLSLKDGSSYNNASGAELHFPFLLNWLALIYIPWNSGGSWRFIHII